MLASHPVLQGGGSRCEHSEMDVAGIHTSWDLQVRMMKKHATHDATVSQKCNARPWHPRVTNQAQWGMIKESMGRGVEGRKVLCIDK